MSTAQKRQQRTTRDALVNQVVEYQDQRDSLYSQTVNPRRNAQRAITALVEGDRAKAYDCLLDVVRDLEGVAQLYRDYSEAP